MTTKGFLEVEWFDEKWLHLSEENDRNSYVAVRLDRPELRIAKKYLYGEPLRLSEFEPRIKRLTGKSSEELVESGKKIYERMGKNLLRFSSFERDILELYSGTILISFGGAVSSAGVYSSTPPEAVAAAILGGLLVGVGFSVLYRHLRAAGYLDKNVRNTVKELNEFLKGEGIKYGRIISYKCYGNDPNLKLKL